MPDPRMVCSVDGCTRPKRGPGRKWCDLHYGRWYRHGDPLASITDRPVRFGVPRKYRSRWMPGHPLAGANHKVYLHRLVLWEKIGPGAHPCYWCGETVVWQGEPRLVVDHFDEDGDNNHPDNLNPSCTRCNTSRARNAQMHRSHEAGWYAGPRSNRPKVQRRLEAAATAAARHAPRLDAQ